MRAPTRRTRPCEGCRDRHLKCNSNSENGPCSNCRRLDIECVQVTKGFRFRDAAKPKTTPGFSVHQTWVQPPKRKLSFRDETADVARASGQEIPSTLEQTEGVDCSAVVRNPPTVSPTSSAPTADQSWPSPELNNRTASENTQQQDNSLIEQHRGLPTSFLEPAPAAHSNAPLMNDLSSSVAMFGTDSPPALTAPVQGPSTTVSLSLQEACLMRHFIENLAHAFDTTDRDAHYTYVVPQRAMQSPVLRYAIFTTSARHITSLWSRASSNTVIQYDATQLPDLTEESAIHYHNVCLSLLKDFTNTPASKEHAETRADALAATTILRFYEQLDTSLTGLDSEAYQNVVHAVMSNHHSEPLYTLESIEKIHRDKKGLPIISETLRFSACMIALRQEIWSVLLYRRPFRLPLSLDSDYSALGPADDFLWANRIILWCADVLRFCFGPDTATTLTSSAPNLAFERWDAMKAFEESWNMHHPLCFKPLYYSPPDPMHGVYFATIWHVNDCQVIGMQHLELGRMLLSVYNPRRQRVGIGSSATNNVIEHQLRQSILRLCGLASANKTSQAGMTTAAIGISIGGEYFYRPGEQQAIIDFLMILEEEHAWPTRAVIVALQDAWSLQHTRPASPAPRTSASMQDRGA